MHEHKYSLAKAELKKSDPKFVKAARQSSSDKPENLERRRLDFQQEYMILQALIARIQELNGKLHEEHEINARAKLEQEIAGFSNLANLKGLAGLYEGFALLADLLSFRELARDDNGKLVLTDKGEKIYVRIPILYDLGADLEDVFDQQKYTNRLLFKMALKQGLVHVGQRGLDPDAPVSVPGAEVKILSEQAPAGVPESDLKAAQAQPTDAQVEQFVKGETK